MMGVKVSDMLNNPLKKNQVYKVGHVTLTLSAAVTDYCLINGKREKIKKYDMLVKIKRCAESTRSCRQLFIQYNVESTVSYRTKVNIELLTDFEQHFSMKVLYWSIHLFPMF